MTDTYHAYARSHRSLPARNVVTLLGRLGNQLSALAFGHWLETTTGLKSWYDLSYVPTPDVLRLGAVGLRLRKRLVLRTPPQPTVVGWRQELAGNAGSSVWPTRIVHNVRRTGGPDSLADRFTPNVDTHAWWYGHWGTEYAAAFAPTLSRALEEVRRCLPPPPFLGLSVRRGDMLNTPFAVQAAWFSKAVARLHEIDGGTADLPIRVFSDDLPWCKQNLDLGVDLQFANSPDPIRQLAELSSAAAVIISRSSFAWWAAKIASLRSARIVYPAPWALVARQPKASGDSDWIAVDTGTY